ncbi:MAG: GNAT family N-acetyltransferase [Prevotella sp.]|nr:GNAT family N-acetyltransferase [Prevotella sp.]
MESTFVSDMETKIETTNTGGKVLAYDGDELVGRLEFSFDRNAMSIDHTYAFKKGMGIGGVLVSAANDYAVSKGLRVKPVCSFASVWYERHPQFGNILNSAI